MEDLLLEPDGHPFINACFNWMILNFDSKLRGCMPYMVGPEPIVINGMKWGPYK